MPAVVAARRVGADVARSATLVDRTDSPTDPYFRVLAGVHSPVSAAGDGAQHLRQKVKTIAQSDVDVCDGCGTRPG
jgi:hypothetical protein